ncbi:TSA1-like protein isoform X7 [Brassica rapa]|uniref:TSA1-like protein isoform X7 n=1 Tax=Brassica campestris TaxID=3711 RepID=UPI00142E429E|nr:TSA1-like protein isoform X7 [Brassica rapa]
MGTKFLALCLSLCLIISSFYKVSCQDEGTTGLNLDLIEREYQASLQGNEGVDQISGQKNSTVTDNNTISLSLSEESVETTKDSADTSSQLGPVTDEVVTPSSMLDHIELEFQAAHRKKMLEEIEREFEAAAAGFEQFKIDDSTQGEDDEQSAMRKSMLEEIERDFEAATKGLEQLKADDLTGVNYAEHAAKRQKMLEEIEREFEDLFLNLLVEATKGLEELRHSTSSTDDESHSARRQSMLDEIEREFEAATSGLKQLKINAYTVEDNDKEQAARRQSMLDAIEREFEAVTESFKQIDDLADSKDEEDQSAKRQSMLDEIEREFEAATSSLKQLNLDDFTEGDDSEQNARRNSMLEAIEREFEDATKGLEELKASDSTHDNDDDEHTARRKSMLDAIEREFEAATRGLAEIKNHEEQAETQRNSMLEEIEREFEAAAASAKAAEKDSAAKKPPTISTVQKTYGGFNGGFDSLLKPSDGVCGCFNKDKDGLKADTDSSINLAEILAEKSKSQDSETSSLTTSLTNLVHTHRKETTSKVSTVLGSSVTSTTSESSATSETLESLKQTLKKLRGLTARDLVHHPNFDEIIEAGTRYEVLSSASIGYISLLAKYKTVIKEGLEASQRVHLARTRAKILKETAVEKQRAVDAEFALAKSLAQGGDALSIKIFAIKKLLVKLEAEKVSVDLKFKSTESNLGRLLKEASQAYEEYHAAVRKAKDEQAAEEFALETTKRAEHIWVEFLSSLN